MSDVNSEWPPPLSPDDRYEQAPVWDDDAGRHQLVRLRVVRLWGRLVLIDAAGRVHCDGCNELIDVAELGRRNNGHRPGLPFRATGTLAATN